MKMTLSKLSHAIKAGKTKIMAGLLMYSMPLITWADDKKTGGGIGGLPVHKEASDAFKTGGGAEGDWIGIIKGYIGQGGTLIALAVSVLGFLWVSYAALAKFNECRLNKAEWSELGVLVIAAAALLVFITLLLTISKETVDSSLNFKSIGN